jgi:hypothetical protein
MTSELQHLSTVTTKTGRELYVCRGYDDAVVRQLVEKSREADIMQRCPKDAAKRFAGPETFDAWVHKGIGGRVLYPLLDHTEELNGVIWLGVEKFGHDAYPPADEEQARQLMLGCLMTDTYAIRMYESSKELGADGELHGSGVAKEFTRATIRDYTQLRTVGDQADKPTFTGIHLETDIDNLAARSTYEHLGETGEGFWPIAENPDINRVAMALPLLRMGEVIDLESVA